LCDQHFCLLSGPRRPLFEVAKEERTDPGQFFE
jgi:hypothetical protein